MIEEAPGSLGASQLVSILPDDGLVNVKFLGAEEVSTSYNAATDPSMNFAVALNVSKLGELMLKLNPENVPGNTMSLLGSESSSLIINS